MTGAFKRSGPILAVLIHSLLLRHAEIYAYYRKFLLCFGSSFYFKNESHPIRMMSSCRMKSTFVYSFRLSMIIN